MKTDLGSLWHALGGAAIAAAATAAGAPTLATLPILAVGGVLREVVQHLDDEPVMTWHRWVEGLAWVFGGVLGVIVYARIAG